jgi:hypothetical protein
MRYLALLLFSMPALADGLFWAPITTDKDQRPLPPNSLVYQVYQDGKPFGPTVNYAPTVQNAYQVPNCVSHTYTVTAIYGSHESDPSNGLKALPCIPATPVAGQVLNAQLLACKIENTKAWAANKVCQDSLKDLQTK